MLGLTVAIVVGTAICAFRGVHGLKLLGALIVLAIGVSVLALSSATHLIPIENWWGIVVFVAVVLICAWPGDIPDRP